MDELRTLLANDIVVRADGGGKVRAALRPVTGIEDVMTLQAGLARVFAAHGSRLVRYGVINGLPGFVTIEGGDTLQTTALQIEGERIVAVYVTRNPEKLRHLACPVLH
jgi:RNA polymerase sigma-70 factor (ECF subfamily)